MRLVIYPRRIMVVIARSTVDVLSLEKAKIISRISHLYHPNNEKFSAVYFFFTSLMQVFSEYSHCNPAASHNTLHILTSFDIHKTNHRAENSELFVCITLYFPTYRIEAIEH
jgi:hypothetical protein